MPFFHFTLNGNIKISNLFLDHFDHSYSKKAFIQHKGASLSKISNTCFSNNYHAYGEIYTKKEKTFKLVNPTKKTLATATSTTIHKINKIPTVYSAIHTVC
mgnify:CR=1 FL=1